MVLVSGEAGWVPDEQNPGRERYFDGVRFTGLMRVHGASPPQNSSKPETGPGFWSMVGELLSRDWVYSDEELAAMTDEDRLMLQQVRMSLKLGWYPMPLSWRTGKGAHRPVVYSPFFSHPFPVSQSSVGSSPSPVVASGVDAGTPLVSSRWVRAALRAFFTLSAALSVLLFLWARHFDPVGLSDCGVGVLSGGCPDLLVWRGGFGLVDALGLVVVLFLGVLGVVFSLLAVRAWVSRPGRR